MNPLLVILVGLCAVYLAIGLRRHPRVALTLWVVCIIALPVWPEVRLGASLQPLSVLAICLLPGILTHWRGRLRAGDWTLIAFAALSTLAWIFFDAPQSAWIAVFTQWIAAYLVGRSLGPAAGREWVNNAMATAGVFVGAWAIIEFVFSLHIFENWFVALDAAGWHTIQIRGAFARSEGAFGHSIAMGGVLALCTPFVLAIRTSTARRTLMLLVVVGGCLATFSRGAIIGVALAVVLSLMFLPGTTLSVRARSVLIALTGASAVVVVPWLFSLFDSVSSDLTVSTDYREDLALSFLADLHPLGLGDGVQFIGGRQIYRQFTSIDNAYALMGLQLGWLPLSILIIGLMAVAVKVLSRRGDPADVSLAAQAVVLGTVALITQYGLAVFFVVGLAVGFGSARRRRQPARTSPSSSSVFSGRNASHARNARLR